jgi:hypothetical protein
MPNWAPNSGAFLRRPVPPGLNDVLEVGLDEQGSLAEVDSVGQFDDRLVMLDTPANPRSCAFRWACCSSSLK